MAKSVTEMLNNDMECEGLLECFHGLKLLDKECFQVLVRYDEPLTVDEIAEEVDRERSTTYRSIQRLLKAGLVEKDQLNYEQGGYYHVYHATESDAVTDEMQNMLNAWYAKMGQLLQEFEQKYGETDPEPMQTDH
ncbi:MAG: helix-turn-helix domain-containing protein [Halobacteriota archaeon]